MKRSDFCLVILLAVTAGLALLQQTGSLHAAETQRMIVWRRDLAQQTTTTSATPQQEQQPQLQQQLQQRGRQVDQRPHHVDSDVSQLPAAPPLAGDRGCPSVYIYNASQFDVEELKAQGFGLRLPENEPWLYDSNQHGLGALILQRLLSSKRCRSESDPAKADVFILPISFRQPRKPTEEESNKIWDFMPPPDVESLWEACQTFVEPSSDWARIAPHLNAKTAGRHLLVPTAYFDFFGFCAHADKGWELALDRNQTLSRIRGRIVQVANGPLTRARIGIAGAHGRGKAFDAPLVSSVHLTSAADADASFGSAMPWAETRTRPYLVSYGGSTEGSRDASRLRKLLVEQCSAAGDDICHLLTHQIFQKMLPQALNAKRDSVFCLEPPWIGSHRKSQVDSLTLGCIPVMFEPIQDKFLWSLHWGPFREDSRVLLNIRDVLSGKIDVITTLRAIPQARVREMQAAIAKHAHRMHYGYDDTPGDALEILLNGIIDHVNGIRTDRSGRRTVGPLDPEDLPDPLASDCVDREYPFAEKLPEVFGGQSRDNDHCKMLLSHYAKQDCRTTALPSGKLLQLYLSDVCPKSCELCSDRV